MNLQIDPKQVNNQLCPTVHNQFVFLWTKKKKNHLHISSFLQLTEL